MRGFKRRWLIAGLILASAFVPAACGRYGNALLDDRKDAAEEIVKRVETFRQQHDRLPGSLSDIGMQGDESGPAYYERKDDQRYIAWYGTTLGHSVVYHSDTRRWTEE
jgi:hypothetical protein